MEKPFVSICCITYNHEPYIKDALEGFLSQKTSFPYEVVISDDCSTDNTRAIIAEYKSRYPNIIRDISPKSNLGVFANFKYVQEEAKGKYTALCEGDDFWTDPYKLQKQIDILEADESLIACCTNHKVVDLRGNLLHAKTGGVVPQNKEGRYNLRDFFRDNHCYPTLSMVYRNTDKDEILAKFTQTRNDFLGDWTLWISLLIYGDMYYLDEATCAYRINPTSVTHTVNRIARAKASMDICCKVADILPEKYADIATDLRNTDWEWMSIAHAARIERRYDLMIWYTCKSFVRAPKYTCSYIHNLIKRIVHGKNKR